MKAKVIDGHKVRGETRYRVVDGEDPDEQPILNRSGEPIDGGGHRRRFVSEMLAAEVNEVIKQKSGASS